MSDMRAKMRVANVTPNMNGDTKVSETLHFTAVGKSESYGEKGDDENNTYASFTPSADVNMLIANPELFDTFAMGAEYYVDFTKATA